MIRHTVAAVTMSLGIGYAWAATPLSDAMDSALLNEPALQATAAQHRADLEVRSRARADLLPQLSAQLTKSRNTTAQQYTASGTAGTPTYQSYDADSKSISLRQALIKPRSWFAYVQSGVSISASDATFESVRQQTLDKVVTAFTDRLRLEAEYLAAKADVEAAGLRVKNVRRLNEAGRVSDVELRRSEADFAASNANMYDALSSLQMTSNELGRLTGEVWSTDGVPELEWSGIAVKLLVLVEPRIANRNEPEVDTHPEVMVRKFNHESAQLEIRKRQSDHSPTLDLVATKSDGTSASETQIGVRSKTTAIGVQLNIPIFSGGMVNAGIREGVALKERAEFDLKNITQLVLIQRKSTRSTLQSNILSAKAGIESVKANELLVTQVRMGIGAGLNSEVDLLDAQAKRVRANAVLARSVTGMVSYLSKYLLSLGHLNVDEFKDISGAFGAI